MKAHKVLLLLLMLSSLCSAQTDSLPVVGQEKVWQVAEEMPTYPGGRPAWERYLREKLRYPEEAKRAGVKGMVYIGFVVCEDGSIYNPEVLSGIGYGCDEEALRVIAEMPNWLPGKQKGIPVPVRYSLPVKFSLQP